MRRFPYFWATIAFWAAVTLVCRGLFPVAHAQTVFFVDRLPAIEAPVSTKADRLPLAPNPEVDMLLFSKTLARYGWRDTPMNDIFLRTTTRIGWGLEGPLNAVESGKITRDHQQQHLGDGASRPSEKSSHRRGHEKGRERKIETS